MEAPALLAALRVAVGFLWIERAMSAIDVLRSPEDQP
jgi:hypothetical protein